MASYFPDALLLLSERSVRRNFRAVRVDIVDIESSAGIYKSRTGPGVSELMHVLAGHPD
jgi:hypothetical protein